MMREKAAIVDLAAPVWGNETTGSRAVSVEIPGGADLVMIGTTEDIVAGSVLFKSSLRLPESVHFSSRRYGSWKILTGIDGFAAERKLSETGWNFFFVVPEIRRSALSSNRSKALRGALKKIVSATEAQNFNALEIVGVTTRRFLGLHYAKVVAHARHIKRSPFLRDIDPYHVSRNVWDFKGVLRRRAQIGRSTKGV